MALRAEDGSLLEVKEAIVLSKEGEPIAGNEDPYQDTNRSIPGNIRIFKTAGWLTPVIILAVGAFIALGTVFLGLFLAFIAVILLVRMMKRLFS